MFKLISNNLKVNVTKFFFNFMTVFQIFLQSFFKFFLEFFFKILSSWFLQGLDIIILKFLLSDVLEINFEIKQIFYILSTSLMKLSQPFTDSFFKIS